MDPISRRNIRNLLKKQGVKPSKRLGQNFLIDGGAIKKIIQAAQLKPNDIVLEVGPGLGALTVELAKKAGKVIAVEKDLKMIEILKETLKDFKNVKIVSDDILKIENHSPYLYGLGPAPVNRGGGCKLIENYKVVANLPFYLTAPVIRKFLETKNPPTEMILVVQKEVAQRICAKVPDMNLLAVSVQLYAEPEIVSYVSKKSFWPSPKVDSSVIKVSAFNQHRKSAFDEQFFKIVRSGFSQPRKQLLNNLSKGLKLKKEKVKPWLLKNGIDPEQRAETLSIDDWLKLAATLT